MNLNNLKKGINIILFIYVTLKLNTCRQIIVLHRDLKIFSLSFIFPYYEEKQKLNNKNIFFFFFFFTIVVKKEKFLEISKMDCMQY